MAIHYSGVDFEHREIALKNKPIDLLDASPKGTVPVLVDGDAVIDQSIDIMAWALGKADPDDWLYHSLDHETIALNDGEFKCDLDRYKYFDRYPEHPQSWYFEKVRHFLMHLETMFIANNKSEFFLGNSKISALDIAIFPFVRQCAFVDKARFDALDLPKLHQWLAFFLAADVFLEIMIKTPEWVSGK